MIAQRKGPLRHAGNNPARKQIPLHAQGPFAAYCIEPKSPAHKSIWQPAFQAAIALMLLGALNLFDGVTLDGVAHLDVLIAVHAHAAFIALLDGFDVVLEAL